uniref:Uncharacterized protein n=1 Tax=Setaria viridis TaxID=4556 RepID=A0A4V6D8K7_SETVI|nr:hypothetical protein SEVIR_6G103414v2 [Setaria viridis]
MVHHCIPFWSGPLLLFHTDLSLHHLQLASPISNKIEGCSAVHI